MVEAPAQITKAEFEAKWGPRLGRYAVPAALDWPSCDEDICEGWHWGRPDIVRENVEDGRSPKRILAYLEDV